MSGESSKPWPTELRLHKDRKTLTVVFDDAEAFDLTAEYLRVSSPSAEVQGHSPNERKTVGGKSQVAILEVNPVGNYAVRLVFDDMHSTGIYSWDYADARPQPRRQLAGLSQRTRRQRVVAVGKQVPLLLPHDHRGADLDAVVEVDHVLVGQAEAT